MRARAPRYGSAWQWAASLCYRIWSFIACTSEAIMSRHPNQRSVLTCVDLPGPWLQSLPESVNSGRCQPRCGLSSTASKHNTLQRMPSSPFQASYSGRNLGSAASRLLSAPGISPWSLASWVHSLGPFLINTATEVLCSRYL